MKGSHVLTILIAFYAVQSNEALDSTSSPSTTAPDATDGPSTPALDSTSSPSTTAPDATDGPSTPALDSTSSPSTTAPDATDGPSTPALDSTSSPSTTAPDATDGPSTPALDSTSSPSTTAPDATDGPSTPALDSTSSPSTTAPDATDGPSTPALDSTSSPSTMAPDATDGPSTPALDSTSSPSTMAPDATDGPSTPALDSTSTLSTTAPDATDGPSTPALDSTSSPSTMAPDATDGPSTPALNATSSPPVSNVTSPSTPTPNATELPSTTQVSLPCAIRPCKNGATCINLQQEHVCQCPYGLFYGLSGCQSGKLFPGQLLLTAPFDKEMQTINSSAYQEIYNNVTKFFNDTFQEYADYKQTILVSVEQSSSTSTRLRMAGTTTDVKIINIFNENTNLTKDKVTEIINEKLNGSDIFKSFTNITQCDVYGCDKDTTDCVDPEDAQPFPTCNCRSNLAKKNPEDKACLLCDEQCTSKNHKQCLFHSTSSVPYCRCQPDYELKEGKCEQCSFGFSGKDCRNNFLAILVGVAIACGVVIIVLTGVLIYKSLRSQKESSSETRSLLNNDYSSTGRVPENNYATNVATREKIFPRVQTINPAAVNKTVTDSQGGQARNTQEPGIANKAYIPERDYDDDDNPWLEMSARGKF